MQTLIHPIKFTILLCNSSMIQWTDSKLTSDILRNIDIKNVSKIEMIDAAGTKVVWYKGTISKY